MALRMLAHLAGDDEALDRFVALTGIGLAELKTRADQVDVLIAVLEYYLNHEPSLLAMAQDTGIDPAMPALAYQTLSGTAVGSME